jgi:outer membrane cobalamin receptor
MLRFLITENDRILFYFQPMKTTPSCSWISLSFALHLAAACLVLGGCAALYAQQDSLVGAAQDTLPKKRKPILWDSTATVDKMVVTGTRTQRSIKDNPANVTVITHERIESSPATNVTDLLLYEPGVLVRRQVGMGEGVPSDISMRGVPGATAAARTLILVDGIPTNAAGTPFLIINEIPMESIERIEVVRGPYSNLYGPNAFGGVINIITKTPQKGLHGGITGGGYSDFYDGDAQVSAALGRFSFLVNGAARGIVNYYGTDSVRLEAGNLWRMASADNYGYYDKRFFGKFSYAFSSRATLTLNARYFNSDLGFGKTEYDSTEVKMNRRKYLEWPVDIIMKGQKYLVGPVIKVTITPSWDITAGGYFRNITSSYNNWGILRTDTLRDSVTGADSLRDEFTNALWKSSSNDWQANVLSTLKLGQYNTLSIGADLLNNAMAFGPRRDAVTGVLLKGADSSQTAMLNAGMYVQDELKLWQRLIAVAGIRIDYNSFFGLVPSPRAGVVYKQNNALRFKLSAGRAFRAPSLAELYMPDLPINTTTTLQANPDLKPEYIWAIDGGPEWDITKWMGLRISGFYNSMDNLISQKVTNAGYLEIINKSKLATLSHRNVEKAWSAGLENSLEMRAGNSGSFFINYTYTESEDMKLHTKLEYIPQHQCNAGIYLKKSFGRFTISGSITENFMGARDYLDWAKTMQNLLDTNNTTIPLPSSPTDLTPTDTTLSYYFRTDGSVKVDYNDFVWISLEGLNLTNEKIVETAGTYAPRRFIFLRLGIKF